MNQQNKQIAEIVERAIRPFAGRAYTPVTAFEMKIAVAMALEREMPELPRDRAEGLARRVEFHLTKVMRGRKSRSEGQ